MRASRRGVAASDNFASLGEVSVPIFPTWLKRVRAAEMSLVTCTYSVSCSVAVPAQELA